MSKYTVSMSDSSIWPIDRTLSGANTRDQSGPGSDVNKGFRIPQRLFNIWDNRWGRDAVGVFYSLSRLRQINKKWNGKFLQHSSTHSAGLESLLRGKTPPNVRPGYDTKPYVDEAPVLELWGMRSAPSLLLLPDPHVCVK